MIPSAVVSAGAEEVLPTDFGKYRLVKKIATGGMAEIFLAHARDRPSQPIVIKRILPHLVKSAEFVSMFLDEARIAAQLQHDNIARIHDIGQQNGAYFIVMEYVHGEDIRRIYNAAYKLQRSLPLAHSIRVIADAALGLAYAHKLTDFTGRPMGVVHRDVSPQNILVTYEGGVKVVDFGIAKAANKVNQTRAGVLKGKYSYMSPEQALGDPIDHRTDIFALGIILYETTTGTRLFKRHSELATLQAIIKCEMTPPGEALPGYPPDLEEILLKALAREPDNRYDDAQALSEALYHFLHQSELYVEREVIAEFMADLFADRLELERGSGEPAVPEEDEVREEMRESTTPMRTRPRAAARERDAASDFSVGSLGEGTAPELHPGDRRRAHGGSSLSVEIPATVLRPLNRARPFTEPMRGPGERIDDESRSSAANSAPGATRNDGPAPDMLPTVAAEPIYQPGPLSDAPTQAPVAVAIRAIARSEASSVIEDPTRLEPSAEALVVRGTAALPADGPASGSSLEDTLALDHGERTTARNRKDAEPAARAPERVPERASERASERAPERAPERPSERAADRAPAASAAPAAQERNAGAASSAAPAAERAQGTSPPARERIVGATPAGAAAERAAQRARAEETERVRLRAQAGAKADRERERRRVPTATSIGRNLAPRLAIAVGAVVAAILAGILASRLLSQVTERNAEPPAAPAAAAERYGRVTILTEPGAAVYAGNELLGLATGQGIAGPFRVRAGPQDIKVAIEDVGFERARRLEIQGDRIHEFEIRGRKGFLRVQAQPWAQVKVDSHDVGITPLPSLPLLEGTHRISLENPDLHRRYQAKVRIEPGGIAELKINLNSDGQPM